MKISGHINQITSDAPLAAYINIMDDSECGQIGVWGHNSNTLLVIKNNFWQVRRFDLLEYMTEWMEENLNNYDKITSQ